MTSSKRQSKCKVETDQNAENQTAANAAAEAEAAAARLVEALALINGVDMDEIIPRVVGDFDAQFRAAMTIDGSEVECPFEAEVMPAEFNDVMRVPENLRGLALLRHRKAETIQQLVRLVAILGRQEEAIRDVMHPMFGPTADNRENAVYGQNWLVGFGGGNLSKGLAEVKKKADQSAVDEARDRALRRPRGGPLDALLDSMSPGMASMLRREIMGDPRHSGNGADHDPMGSRVRSATFAVTPEGVRRVG